MLAYILLVAVPLIYYGLLRVIRNSNRLIALPDGGSMLNVFFGIYFLLLALRGVSVGVDVPNYLSKFQYANHLSWREWFASSSWEPGFMALTKLVSLVSDQNQVYLAVIAAVVVIPIARFYRRETEGPVLTMALFLILPMFGMFFSGLRQAVAIMFAVPAYGYTRDKKWVKFLLVVLAAMLFHQSAFILLLLYPVYHLKLPRISLIWILPLIAVIYRYSAGIFRYLLTILSRLYTDNTWEVSSTGAYSMLVLFVMLMIFSYVFIDEDSADPDLLGLRNILVLAVLLQCFASVNTLAMRMNYYFLLFLPLLIPKVIRRASGTKALVCNTANVVLCLYFITYFMNQVFSRQSGFRIFPYVPFWEA